MDSNFNRSTVSSTENESENKSSTECQKPHPSLHSFSISVNQDECFLTEFSTLESIKNWATESKNDNLINRIVCPLKERSKRNGPKVIFCHDYIYNFSEPILMETPLWDEMQFYTFPYWSLIDIFIYFSHKFLTVPPASWISACHQNGVMCLGTIMIEHWSKYWSNKKMITKGTEFLFIVLEETEILAKSLFDGWLINIECPVGNVSRLENFISVLKRELPPGSKIIWYDSVIKTGSLHWQNELNEKNRNFFDISDGIFLNYHWNNENLEKSVSTCLNECGRSLSDVFIGIDCHGRGCMGDGGYGTYLAVKEALKYNLSVAIFAPAWTHESKLDNSNILSISFKIGKEKKSYYKKENYSIDDEYKFWSKIAIDGNLIECEKELSTLPLFTSFNIGYGFNYYDLGICRLLHDSSCRWLNMQKNETQPSFFKPHQMKNEDYQLSISTNLPFNGGSSFQIQLFNCQVKRPITLFRTRILNSLLSFRYQLVYRFQNTNLIDNNWLRENIRVRTIIDYIEIVENSENIDQFLFNDGTRGRKNNPNIKRLILNHKGWNIEHTSNMDLIDPGQSYSYEHNKIIPLNNWNCQQLCIDLKKCEQFNNNNSILFLTFSILPYFISNEMNLDQINQDNSLYFHIGEFYFDYFENNSLFAKNHLF